MNHLVIENVPPWDGEYELPDFVFTNRELFRIKEISGIRGGELVEAIIAQDSSAFVALAVIVLGRVGKNAGPDDFWDVPHGAIRLRLGDDDEQEADADVPPASGPSSVDDPSESIDTSGPGSDAGGA